MRKFVWREAIIAAVLIFLAATWAEATSADRVAEMLGITRNVPLQNTPGELWVGETRKTLQKFAGEVTVSDMIKTGAPIYRHIRALVERKEFDIYPELVAGELSKVTEYGDVNLKFDDNGDSYAKKTLVKAASYLPSEIVGCIPTLEAFTVIGRGLFLQYTSERAVIKTNGVKISLHELGHALEHSTGHLLLLRKEFYENRTRGKMTRKLRYPLFPFGYRSDEKYRAGFVDRYMGKEGGVELYSCGLEYVFFNRNDIWRRDPEATKFILGCLIFYGNQTNSVQ